MNIPEREDLLRAKERLGLSIHRTPILSSTYLNHLSGSNLYFKYEGFQKTGSFKARGALNSVLQLKETQKTVCTHSSGNHGQALAWAANKTGKKAVIVMPENAPKAKVEAVKNYGAEVIFCAPNMKSREETAKRISDERNAVIIPPFDFFNTICGQSTVAQEIIEDYPKLDYIIVPTGGGGLLAGTSLAAKYFSETIKVIGAEPELADDAFRSFESGKRVTINSSTTIADGLRTSLGILNFEIMMKFTSKVLLCSDKEIIDSMKLIYERMKIIVEPSCAVGLAVVLRNPSEFKNKKVGIILTGANLDLGKLPF